MNKNDEFYVPYIEGSLGSKTKKVLKKFVIVSVLLVLLSALLFSFTQKKFVNSSFELTTDSKITGIYHENPYPMLRIKMAEDSYKNVLLLGFGKFGANPHLKKIRDKVKDINGKTLSIEGNLIYYNGKTLLQITDDEKVTLVDDYVNKLAESKKISKMTLTGEIIDPKCYFGVMKPGYGKIHRSCAARCISGGIPPVFATTDNNKLTKYFLITDSNRKPIHKDVLPFIGKPSEITGVVEQMEDWYLLKINTSDIKVVSEKSNIY